MGQGRGRAPTPTPTHRWSPRRRPGRGRAERRSRDASRSLLSVLLVPPVPAGRPSGPVARLASSSDSRAHSASAQAAGLGLGCVGIQSKRGRPWPPPLACPKEPLSLASYPRSFTPGWGWSGGAGDTRVLTDLREFWMAWTPIFWTSGQLGQEAVLGRGAGLCQAVPFRCPPSPLTCSLRSLGCPGTALLLLTESPLSQGSKVPAY